MTNHERLGVTLTEYPDGSEPMMLVTHIDNNGYPKELVKVFVGEEAVALYKKLTDDWKDLTENVEKKDVKSD